MSWLAQFFSNPAFVLPGAALVSVPIIIHLLSRLRYKRVRFAAMEFLLQSDELNRRRLIIEQLLLLLLRTLAVLLIVLLIAKLTLDPSAMLLLRGASTHHVIILDDTLSMQSTAGNEKVFDRAIDTLQRMVSVGNNKPGAQRVSILTLSEPDRPLITDRQLDAALVQELTPRLNNLRCSYKAAGMAPALQSAGNLIGDDGGVAPQIHVLTDLRKSDWGAEPDLVSAIEALDKADAAIRVVQVSNAADPNVAITALETDTTSVAVGVPFRLNLTFHNFGNMQAVGLRATVLVNGEALPIRILMPDIEANSDAVMAHDITFDAPGLQDIEVRLEEDVMNADNRRYVSVEVSENRRVLIVDDGPRQNDARFVSLAISDPELTGVAAELRTSDVLTSARLADYDSIYLLNVRELPADAVQSLKRYVSAGGGIAWFPGANATFSWYSGLAEGTEPLFPAKLTTIHSEADTTGEADAFQLPAFEIHPIFLAYNDPESALADTLQFKKWLLTSEQSDNNSVQVLARMADGSPIAFEHELGEGNVLTFLTTAGGNSEWNNWPVADAPGYVVMHLLIQQYLQKPSTNVAERPLADELAFTWPVTKYTETLQVFLPESAEDASTDDSFLRLQASPLDNEDEDAEEALFVKVPQANRPGVYRLQRFLLDGESETTKLALNVPTTESDLTLAAADEIMRLSDKGRITVVEAGESQELTGSDNGREIRNLLLALLIGVLIAEQLLSLRLSFHPEAAS